MNVKKKLNPTLSYLILSNIDYIHRQFEIILQIRQCSKKSIPDNITLSNDFKKQKNNKNKKIKQIIIMMFII